VKVIQDLPTTSTARPCAARTCSEGAIAADGDDLFVANGQGSLTEIDALTVTS